MFQKQNQPEDNQEEKYTRKQLYNLITEWQNWRETVVNTPKNRRYQHMPDDKVFDLDYIDAVISEIYKELGIDYSQVEPRLYSEPHSNKIDTEHYNKMLIDTVKRLSADKADLLRRIKSLEDDLYDIEQLYLNSIRRSSQ